MNSSNSIFDTTENLMNNPDLFTKKFSVRLILSDNFPEPCDFKMELTTGKVLIVSKHEISGSKMKIKFNLSDAISLLSEDELESTSVHNKKIQISSEYGEDIFEKKKYAQLNYFPKRTVRSCSCYNCLCMCCDCSLFTTSTKRSFSQIELILSLNAMKDINNHIIQHNNNATQSLSTLLTTNRKYILFANDEFITSKYYTNTFLMIMSKAHIDIEHHDINEIENVILNLTLNECNGIVFLDRNEIAHRVINTIFKRNDIEMFLDKIPIGSIPFKDNSAQGLLHSIAYESKESVDEITAAFTIARGLVNEMDVIEVKGVYDDSNSNNDNDNGSIYGIINVAWGPTAGIDARYLNSKSCCDTLTKKIHYWCSALSNTGYTAKFEYLKPKTKVKIHLFSPNVPNDSNTKPSRRHSNGKLFSIPESYPKSSQESGDDEFVFEEIEEDDIILEGNADQLSNSKNDCYNVVNTLNKNKDNDNNNNTNESSNDLESTLTFETIEEQFTYFNCSNLPFVDCDKKIAPKASSFDGYCDIVLMKRSRASGCNLLTQLSESQYKGNYFIPSSGGLKQDLNVNYIKTKKWKVKLNERNKDIPVYIDSIKYNVRNEEIEVNVLSRKIKVFSLNLEMP